MRDAPLLSRVAAEWGGNGTSGLRNTARGQRGTDLLRRIVVRYRSRTLFAVDASCCVLSPLAFLSRALLLSRKKARVRLRAVTHRDGVPGYYSIEKTPTHLLLASTRTVIHLVYRASRPLAMPSASDLR